MTKITNQQRKVLEQLAEGDCYVGKRFRRTVWGLRDRGLVKTYFGDWYRVVGIAGHGRDTFAKITDEGRAAIGLTSPKCESETPK